MSVATIVRQAEVLGIRLWLNDEGLIRADVPEDAPPEADAALDELAAQAAEAKACLRAQTVQATGPQGQAEGQSADDDLAGWPRECIEALRRYHRPPVLVAPHARLFLLMGRRVLTPQGPGGLLAARLDGCQVALDSDPSRAVGIPWEEVRPA